MYKPAYNYAYISKKDFQTDEVEKAGFRGVFNVSLNRLGLTTQLLLNWLPSPCSCSPAQTQVKVVFQDPAYSRVTSINMGSIMDHNYGVHDLSFGHCHPLKYPKVTIGAGYLSAL